MTCADDLEWRAKPGPDLRAMLEDIDGDQLLVGPDRNPDEAEIDPIFAASYAQALEDLSVDLGIARNEEAGFDLWLRSVCAAESLAISPDGAIRIVPAVYDQFLRPTGSFQFTS